MKKASLIRAAIYSRTNLDSRLVSEHRRMHTQVELCLSVALSKGFSEDEIHVYKDHGISGVAKSPPALEKMLNDLKYEAIFISELSRLSRDAMQLSKVYKKIAESGTDIWVCDSLEIIDFNGHEDEKMQLIKQAFIQMDTQYTR